MDVVTNWPDEVKRNRPPYNAVIKTVFSNEGAEPVTLEEAKEHMRIDSGFTADDDYITALITRCRRHIENVKNISLVNRTVIASIKNERGNEPLPYGGTVNTVTAAEDIDGTAILSTSYQIKQGALVTKYDFIKLTYTVTALADDKIRQDLLELIAYKYENRGDQEKPKIAGPCLV